MLTKFKMYSKESVAKALIMKTGIVKICAVEKPQKNDK